MDKDYRDFLRPFVSQADAPKLAHAEAALTCPVRAAGEFPDLDVMTEVRDRIMRRAEVACERVTA